MKLLIVDDSDLLQDRLCHSITEADVTITIAQAYNFKEGMKLFSIFEPDKVILDISLPDGSGIDLLRIFKTNRPSVKVIIFSNNPFFEFRKCCMDLGADHFFDKPGCNAYVRDFVILN